MILYIDTADNDFIFLALLTKDASVYKLLASKETKAFRQQSEKLLDSIDKLLKLKKIKLESLSKIIVNNEGYSFTALRIGVITANALAFSLSIPVYSGSLVIGKDKSLASFSKLKKGKTFAKYSLVEPIYDSEASIGPK